CNGVHHSRRRRWRQPHRWRFGLECTAVLDRHATYHDVGPIHWPRRPAAIRACHYSLHAAGHFGFFAALAETEALPLIPGSAMNVRLRRLDSLAPRIAAVLVFGGLLLLPAFASNFAVSNATFFLVSVPLVLGLVLLWGHCGILSFGQV